MDKLWSIGGNSQSTDEPLVRLHHLCTDENVCGWFNGCERSCHLQVVQNAVNFNFCFFKCCHSKVSVSSFIWKGWTARMRGEKSRAAKGQRRGNWLNSFPASQSHFVLRLFGDYIMQRLRGASLCRAARGCKGGSSRGMKWAQTSASKWFLTRGQTRPRLLPKNVSAAGGPAGPGQARAIKHLRWLFVPSILMETFSFVRSQRTPCPRP